MEADLLSQILYRHRSGLIHKLNGVGNAGIDQMDLVRLAVDGHIDIEFQACRLNHQHFDLPPRDLTLDDSRQSLKGHLRGGDPF